MLRRYWGYDSFRGIQSNIIQSICSGHDTLGLMPTGGGKSITFQVPSMMMEGTCVVITPLIALMKDQVSHLRDLGIKATALYSGMTRNDILTALDNCILGKYKFLYISPERLSSELFQAKLRHMTVNFITVDEAHCISQWGHDFRPSYLQISDIRRLLPHAPVLALTASATPHVSQDIMRQLNFHNPHVWQMSFERPNIAYIVKEVHNKETALLDILRHTTGSTIVYTRNRAQTAEVAKLLAKEDITALHYHAGLETADRDMRQQLWQDDLVRVIVATNAFGMGIDKPDVRTVIHIGMPDSIEAYYQEAGRAGRDGLPAQAILLKSPYDVANLKRHIDVAFPPPDYIFNIYQQLAYYYQLAVGDGCGLRKEFNLQEFCSQRNLFPNTVLSALRILGNAGYAQYEQPEDCVSCAKVIIDRSELYRLGHIGHDCETVLQALLRNYNGLFADLVPIEEILLSQRTKLSPQEVYKHLRTLHLLGIICYIPFKRIAHITFPQSRVDTPDFYLSPEVYDLRKAELEQRIGAMIDYISNKSTCRSRQLSRYFGDTTASLCHRCDNCLRQATSPDSALESVATAVIQLLSDHNPHPYTQLLKLPFPQSDISHALRNLLDQNEINFADGRFSLN